MSNSAALQLRPSFIGPDHVAARVQLQRALDAGLTHARSQVLANIASFIDGWVFRPTLAKFLGLSVKTVQRAINDGRSEGICGVARGKKGERPRGWKGQEPPWCGFSHRWMIARDEVGEVARVAIAWAKASAITRAATAAAKAVTKKVLQRREQKRRVLTDAERLELERIDAESRAREQPD